MHATATRDFRQLPIIGLGLTITVIGAALIGAGVHGYILSLQLPSDRMGKLAGSLVLILVGAVIHVGGRKLNYRAFYRNWARFKTCSIVYLRRFTTSGVSVLGGGVIKCVIRAFMSGPEERFLMNLWTLGAVTTVARPGDRLPDLGTLAVRVPEDEWKPRVEELIRRADFVAVRAADSPSVIWEVKTAVSHMPLQRMVIWFPPEDTGAIMKDNTQLSTIRDVLESALQVDLPADIERNSVVHFDAQGQPVVSTHPGGFLQQHGVPEGVIVKHMLFHALRKFWQVGFGLLFGWIYGPKWWP
jgi:hypothetical protein